MLLLAVFLVGAFATFVFVMRGIRRRRALMSRMTPQPTDERCVCGYSLKGLDTLRCPECGRVVGFDATPEELGLTDEQLKLAHRKRRERQSS